MGLLRLRDGSRSTKEGREDMGVLPAVRPADLEHQVSHMFSDGFRLHKNHVMFQGDKELESALRCPEECLGLVLNSALEMDPVPRE